MKINPKQYAEALYESVREKSKKEIEQILDNFVKVLIVNSDTFKAESIMNEFNKVWNNKEGIVEAKILTAKKLDKKTLSLLNSYLMEILKVKKVNIQASEDEKLLGGVIIKYNDKILDGSIKTKLNTLGNKLKN